MELSVRKRKPLRLKEYDYSAAGYYAVTVCSKNRVPWFWETDLFVGASIARPPLDEDTISKIIADGCCPLSEYGRVVERAILDIPSVYSNVTVETFAIMPDHVHLLLSLGAPQTEGGRPMVAPTDISRVIQQWKGIVTKQVGFPIWQKSFFDHIIRNEQDFQRIWNYIVTNPIKWEEDCYYRG